MTILAIETSCDETSASLVKLEDKKLKLLSNVVSSSVLLHAKTGGIVPETAAREQLKYIIPVVKQSLVSDFDAIATTVGPGLMGSLLIGVETAKTLAYVFNKPIIPVNHLLGHIYANWINQDKKIDFPAIGLIVSGGHTDLILIKTHGNMKWLGGTKDDAAGEALDKTGRLMNLPYPAGPIIERLAKDGNPKAFNFPRPMIGSNDFDFSFSGLKAAVWRETEKNKKIKVEDLCASVQEAIVNVLVLKTMKAAKKYKAKSILIGGGVAANQRLRDELKAKASELNIELFVPSKNLCTDNAAMIAAAAFFNGKPIGFDRISANPQLYFA